MMGVFSDYVGYFSYYGGDILVCYCKCEVWKLLTSNAHTMHTHAHD